MSRPWRLALLGLLGAGCFKETPGPTPSSGTDGSSGVSTNATQSTSATQTVSGSASGGPDTGADPDTTVSGSTSADPAPVCGDGTVDQGEACDDGNDDDLDGCTRTCKPSPQRVTLAVADSAPGLGILEDLPEFTDPCPANRDVTQVLGAITGNVGGPAPPGWPVSIAGECRTLEIIAGDDSPRILASTGATLPEHGLPPNVGEYDTTCPPGTVAVGVRAQLFNSSKTYLVSLALWCAVPELVETDEGFVVQLSSPMPTDLTPADSGAQIEQSFCPSGTVVSGLHGSAYDSIDYLALPCAALLVQQ